MPNLLINIDHVATLRNARKESFPDPLGAAIECERAGADGIVFHLREDRRHITDRDVAAIREGVQSKIDFELSLAPSIVSICCKTVPHLATLVPERREEITTEGGLDAASELERIVRVVDELHEAGIGEVALFLDPDEAQIEAAASSGADAIELHTGDFANARGEDVDRELSRLARAASLANDSGLLVHAGHGLDYQNFNPFRQAVPFVREVSIGFAIVARAVFVGLRKAVEEMLVVVKHG